MYFNANSPWLQPVICVKNTSRNYSSSHTSNFNNLKSFEQLFTTDYYYNAMSWTSEGNTTSNNVQGGDVIGTTTTTVINNHVPRVPSNGYLGLRSGITCSSSAPGAGAWKKLSVQLQSVEFLTSIKY